MADLGVGGRISGRVERPWRGILMVREAYGSGCGLGGRRVGILGMALMPGFPVCQPVLPLGCPCVVCTGDEWNYLSRKGYGLETVRRKGKEE